MFAYLLYNTCHIFAADKRNNSGFSEVGRGWLRIRHWAGDLSACFVVVTSELCEDVNYSQEPEEVADSCHPGIWRPRQEDY